MTIARVLGHHVMEKDGRRTCQKSWGHLYTMATTRGPGAITAEKGGCRTCQMSWGHLYSITTARVLGASRRRRMAAGHVRCPGDTYTQLQQHESWGHHAVEKDGPRTCQKSWGHFNTVHPMTTARGPGATTVEKDGRRTCPGDTNYAQCYIASGLSDYWAVGPMGRRTSGSSDCRTNGLSDYRAVGPMGRQIVGLMGCRTIGLSDQWAVRLSD